MIKESIQHIVEDKSLTATEAEQVMVQIMEGEATPAQLGAFLVALRMKGESPEEILGMVRAMRAKAVLVEAKGDLLDTCGTGGDSSGTYNISTASALVAAAAGVKVAKHGNRSASSQCGSADVLEALGARIAVTPEQARQCLDRVGFAFLFAPSYHPAMRHAAGPRFEIGVRTVFNIMGPLSNPAGASRQLLGVADGALAPKMAVILQQLGTRHALIVHSEDGLDEISLGAQTRVHEVRDSAIRSFTVTPENLGLSPASIEELGGGDKEQNARIIRSLFDGDAGPKRNALLANAGAALYAADKVESIRDGVALAAKTIDGGAARKTLQQYVDLTQSFG